MKKVLLSSKQKRSGKASSQNSGSKISTMPANGGSASSVSAALPTLAERHTRRIALATGVELEYVEQGNDGGTPVIFLHGITDSWHSFETTLPYLPPYIHAFALSQRGHGNSERPEGGYTPTDFAADVAAFIRQKNLGSAVIVGHSMSGVHAQQFALLYPSLTRGVVIIASDPCLRNNPGMLEFHQEVLAIKGPVSREYMTAFQKGTLAKPIDNDYYHLLINEGLKVPTFVFQKALTGLVEVDFTQQLKDVRKPVLVLWGEKDSFFSKQGQEVLVSNLPMAEFILYKETGHAIHWEEPERVAGDIVRFIETNKLNGPEKNQ